ncbi:hypothetical protein CHARACLAT_029827 [Characodon lateralis]|uniref:Uncharacterized protein n=1 Tax=Characodon lateralis TaxID=208331 RepID=A0ABU7DLF1_9TELE|nr:hypothetical protein [Characodon lateralis]
MLCRVLETTPCHSSRESVFHSYLQAHSSEIPSLKYLTIAHLPVYPQTLCAQLKHSRSRITQRECQLCGSLCQSSCQTQPQWGKRISSNKQSSTTNTERWKIKTRMM